MIVDGQIHGGLTMGLAPVAVRGDLVRRARQQPRRDVHGLPPPDGDGDARLGDRQDDHALAAPPAGREGGGGVGDRRRPAGDRQRGRRRALRTSASPTWTSRSRPRRCGGSSTRRASPSRCRTGAWRRGSRRSRRTGAASRSPPSWRSSGRRRPSPGARGIVHPDGTIEGWVGGSCAQPVVVREALRALVDGQPRLLRLSKDGPGRGPPGDGVVELVMTCHSGGHAGDLRGTAPARAAPVGRRHDADRRRPRRPSAPRPAGGSRVFDPIADPDAFPDAERVLRTTATSRGSSPTPRPYVVVATQGIWDEEALAPALRRDVSYVGLVASPTRAAARPRVAARRGAGRPTSGSPPCARRPASTSARRRPRRSRSRSWPSSSRSAAGRRRSWPSPGPRRSPADAGARGAGDRPRARRRRHRPARPGLRDDRRPRARPASRRARRRRLRVLPHGLSHRVHPGAGRVRPGSVRTRSVNHRRGLTPLLGDLDAVPGTVQIAAPRDRVWAFLMDPNQVGSCGPGVESIEVIDADHFKAKAKVGVGFISRPVRRRHDDRRAQRAGPRDHQGPRPGARDPPSTRRRA